ncbi:MAG TPA: hypothetical protein VNU97_07835 [Rhizomicrobium sp.]|jgi:hypothetical protein|nr:hypothetical protein [Rhizomicrobium sp.]
MKTTFLVPLLASLVLAACGNGVATPSELEGKWAADCASPFVSFSGSTIHVFPDDADYALKSVKFEGGLFTVSYDSKTGPVTETYVYANDTLRLDKGTYGGMEAVWHKQPMTRCS